VVNIQREESEESKSFTDGLHLEESEESKSFTVLLLGKSQLKTQMTLPDFDTTPQLHCVFSTGRVKLLSSDSPALITQSQNKKAFLMDVNHLRHLGTLGHSWALLGITGEIQKPTVRLVLAHRFSSCGKDCLLIMCPL